MTIEKRGGHINWKDWNFNYYVADLDGLCLLDGFFKGRKIFYKLSLPVIRVKYLIDANNAAVEALGLACGPYNDFIRWDTTGDWLDTYNPFRAHRGPHRLDLISDCGNEFICIREVLLGNEMTLEIGVYMRIGAYHIYQVYYINEKGVINPRVWSKGVACIMEHTHHPYWRFDFDIDSETPNRFNIVASDFSGFCNSEGRFVNSTFNNPRYNVENLNTGAKVWLDIARDGFPFLQDSAGRGPDNFARDDLWVLKYRPEEDVPWPQMPTHSVQENPDGGDIVVWYIPHLFHKPGEHDGDHWHMIGPTLTVDFPLLDTPDFARHRVRVHGRINLNNKKNQDAQKLKPIEFDKIVTMDKLASHAEIYEQATLEDIKMQIKFALDLSPDGSVSVNTYILLFKSEKLILRPYNHFNVLKNQGLNWKVDLDSHTYDEIGKIDYNVSNSISSAEY